MNYYEILQVSPNAESEVIDAAYRRLARKYHPDVNDDPAAGKLMRLLNQAYEVLKDPDARAAYDASQRRAAAPPTAREPAPAAEPREQRRGTNRQRRPNWAVGLAVAGAVGLLQFAWTHLIGVAPTPAQTIVNGAPTPGVRAIGTATSGIPARPTAAATLASIPTVAPLPTLSSDPMRGTGGPLTDEWLSDETKATFYGCMFRLTNDRAIILGVPRNGVQDECQGWHIDGTLVPSADPVGYTDVCLLAYRTSLPPSARTDYAHTPPITDYSVRVWGTSADHAREFCVKAGSSNQVPRPTVAFLG